MLQFARGLSVCVEKDAFASAAVRRIVNPKAKSFLCWSKFLRASDMVCGGLQPSELFSLAFQPSDGSPNRLVARILL